MAPKRKADETASSRSSPTVGSSIADHESGWSAVSHDDTKGKLDCLSYSFASVFDAWSPVVDEEDVAAQKKAERSRVGHIIYTVQFNPDPPAELLNGFKYLVALVTAEHLILIRVREDGKASQVAKIFVVPDQPSEGKNKQEKEDLYTLQWIKDAMERKIWSAVAFAGATGIIRIMELCMKPPRSAFLRGHAAAVNELSYCKQFPQFLLSGSKDRTIRLWSLKYLVCLATFGGTQGHQGEIISFDVHSSGQFIVSGSYDSCIKIWSLFRPDNKSLLDNIRTHAITTTPLTVNICAPVYSVNNVHDRQIDCIRWVFKNSDQYHLISKASDETVLIWKPILPAGLESAGADAEWILCHKIKLTHNKFWFVKFALLRGSNHVFALGDDLGMIKLYDLQASVKKQKNARNVVRTKINRAGSPSKAVIRNVAFSDDGKILIGANDAGICHLFLKNDKLQKLINGKGNHVDLDNSDERRSSTS